MILGAKSGQSANAPESGPALDALFFALAASQPHRLALTDAANRPALLGGTAQRLTYGALAAKVDRLANTLIAMGLPTDSVVALHMPVASETVIALLAIARAGLIAAPLPLGWGRREIVAQLQRIGARAILTFGRCGPLDTGDLVRHAAAMVFSVRFVGGFGDNLLDGLMPLDPVLNDPEAPVPLLTSRDPETAGAHLAAITAEGRATGHVAVARSHAELIAAGRAAGEALALDADSVLASPLALDNAAGLSAVLVPWLLAGCRLDLHPPFAARVFQAAMVQDEVTHAVLPVLASACLFELPPEQRPALRKALLLARRADDLALFEKLPDSALPVSGLYAPGEAGLLPVMEGGRLMLGRGQFAGDPDAIDTRLSSGGTLMLRGSTVPRHAFPPGAERAGTGVWSADTDSYIDTLVPGQLDNGRIRITGQPQGVMVVGGRTFSEADIRAVYAEAGGDIQPVIRPDALLGQRVAGVIGHGRGVAGLAGRLDMSGLTPLAVPGATRYGGQIPFEDTTPPQLLEQTEEQRAHILRQLLAG